MPIKHNPSQQTFTDGEAELAYAMPSPQVIDFTHTFVPENRRNEGVGEGLAQAGLDYARQHQLRVVPTCPFVAGYIQKHPEYAGLLSQ